MKNLLGAISLGLIILSTTVMAQAPQVTERKYPEGYITGRVTSENGPEAGVWVIAETKETNTPFIKIVVTDDDGNYVLPQLPVATFNVWVRGYGLVDSEKVEGRPGDRGLNLTAVVASTPAEAAEYYPADYWLSLAQFPGDDILMAEGDARQGFAPAIDSQKRMLHEFKSDCGFCHQIGNKITRSLGHMDHLGFDSSDEAWIYRTQTGVRGGSMFGNFAQFGLAGMARTMAAWTDSIEAGALPPVPPRPQGIERNIVVTLRDIGGDQDFMHDEITTDKNNPTVNAYGPTYAVSSGHGLLSVVDPITNDAYDIVIPTRDDPREVPSRFPAPGQPSNFWGFEHLWGFENPSDPHNAMLGPDGRVWITSKIRGNTSPDWCRQGSGNKFAEYADPGFSNRQASVYDPTTGEFELIETCYATHHLQFASDPDSTLYFNELLGPMFGWVNTRIFDQTHDEQAAVGWCPQIIDTNGDGTITKPWNAWDNDNPNPNLDTEIRANMYTVIPDPKNGDIVWGANENSNLHPFGAIVRLDRGDNPPETCISEVYAIPDPGFDPRGMDIDSEGNPWVALAGSSHWAKFERNQCPVLNGAGTQMGTHCEAGWTLYETPGPKIGNTDVPADFHYFGWVDQHNVSGLGKDTPIINGSFSDSLIALDQETGDWTYLRVPYPMGFYSRGLDARIDDPDTGWRGRSIWANYGTHLIWHTEGGKGTTGKMVQFQIRDTPLDY